MVKTEGRGAWRQQQIALVKIISDFWPAFFDFLPVFFDFRPVFFDFFTILFAFPKQDGAARCLGGFFIASGSLPMQIDKRDN